MPTLDYTAAIPGWGGSWSASVSLRYTTAYDAASDSSTITVQALSLGYYGRKGYGTSSETVLTLKAADSGESRSLTLRCSDTSNGGVKTFTAEGCPTALSVRHSGGSGERRVQLSAQSSILVYPTENGGSRYTASGSGSVSLSTGSVAPPPEPPAPPEPPRPSSLVSWPASVATQGTLSLTVSRSSPAYYHKATLRCGSAVLYSSAAFATTLSLTVPRGWFDAYPNSTSLSCTLSVQTYTDSGCGTPVGSPATASLSVTADSGMKPVINSGFLAAAALNAGTAAAGISGYVQGYSKARLTLSRGKLSMANKATVSSYKLSCQGRSRTLSAPGATATMDTDTLTGSSAVTVTVTVTDSRGRTASTSLSVTPMAYARPRLSAISAYRCDSAGRSDEGGAWYYARATGSISALGGQNSLTLQVQSARGSGSFGAAETLSSGAGRVLGGALEPDSGYRLRFTASDALGNSVSVIRELPTRVWAMKFRPDGKGVAFGKAAEYGKALELPADWELMFGTESFQQHAQRLIKLRGTAIPAGADLNDYTDVGSYYVVDGATAAQIANVPETGAGALLKVLQGNIGDPVHRLQVYLVSGYNSVWLFARRYYNGAWGNWYQFTNSYVTNGSVTGSGVTARWYRNGRNCFVSVSGTLSAAVAANASILTGLPAAIDGAWARTSGGTGLSVGSTGSLRPAAALSQGAAVYASFSYITA